MDIKFIKELGSGANGTVYLVEKDGMQLVYKLERMDEYDIDKPLQSEYYRQIKFNEDVAIHHPDKFMILKDHGIIENCTYRHPNYDKIMNEFKGISLKIFLRKNSQPSCCWSLYSPYLEGSYGSVRTFIYEDPKLFLDFIYQIMVSINIMRKKGYAHGDFNVDNIMFKKNNNTYQWYCIDYGNICNNTFPISKMDEDNSGRPLYCMDIPMFINYTCIDSNLLFFAKDNGLDTNYLITDLINNAKNEFVYSDIIKHIPQIKNEKTYNIFFRMVIMILYPQIYLKCIGAKKEIYSKYENKQLFPELLTYCLNHHNDATYDNILTEIQHELNNQIGGNDNYFRKYLKYKGKYMNLKNNYQ